MLHVWPPVGDGDLDLVRRNLTCGPVRYPPIFFISSDWLVWKEGRTDSKCA